MDIRDTLWDKQSQIKDIRRQIEYNNEQNDRLMKKWEEQYIGDTYWLFGSEACSICRVHEQSNIDGKFDYVGVDEIADQIIHDSNIFAIHMSKPRSIDYPMDLLDAYNGWEDYEKIDKDLYDILKIFQIKNRDYSHRKEIISKLNKNK